MCVASNTRSNDDDEGSFYNNGQNPIISLSEPSGSGKMDLLFFLGLMLDSEMREGGKALTRGNEGRAHVEGVEVRDLLKAYR